MIGRFTPFHYTQVDEKELSTVAATVNAGQFIAKLEKAAKRQGSGRGNVVPADLRKALTVPWLAEAVSHVIFRYESEWGGDMGKWEKLMPLMGKLGKPTWTTEMERIKKLQWWEKMSAVKGFPASPDVWHMHPIGLVGNFIDASVCIPLSKAQLLALRGIIQWTMRLPLAILTVWACHMV